MHFEADHDLPLFAAPGQELRHHRSPAMKLGRWVKQAARSRASPTRSTVSSSKARPVICKPSGSPSADNPAGTESAGKPARLAGTVKTSFRYIAIGSSVFSPIAKAADGAVGVRIQSTFSKAVTKSRVIRVRTRCAFK